MSSPPSEALPLDRVEFLRSLRGETAELVRDSFEERTYAFGDAVFRAGDPPDAYYVVVAGRARVVREGPDGSELALNLLLPGATFGESVLDGSPRSATVRASSSQLTVLRLDGALLRALVRRQPDLQRFFGAAARANAVSDLLRTSALFAALPRTALSPLIEHATELELPAGATLFTRGDPPQDAYLVREGRLEVALAEGHVTLIAGDVFGERAVVLDEPRAGTVTAIEPARLLRIHGQELRRMIDADPALRARVDARLRGYEKPPAAVHAADPYEEADAEAELANAVAADADALEPADAIEAAPRRRFKLIRQVDERDCGAACLAMLCRYYGHETSMSFIRQSAGTSVDGTSLGGLKRGGAAVGIEMRLVKSSAEDVDRLPLPAVIHWKGRHWVVLTRIDGDRVRLADPAIGLRTVSRAELAEEWTGYAALPTPTERLADAPRQRIDLGWLAPVVKPLRRTFGAAVLLGLLASALLLTIPILTGVVFDEVLTQRDRGLLHLVVLAMLAAVVIAMGALMLQRWMIARLAIKIDGQALAILTERLLALPLDYFQRRTSVDIERRLSGVRLIRQILVRDGVIAIASVTQIVAVTALMFVYSWVLALAFLAGLPVYGLLMRFSQQRVRPAYALLEEAFARYVFRQIDSTKGILTIKVMGAEAGLGKTLGAEFTKLQGRVFQTDTTVMVYNALIQGATLGLYSVLLWIGALQVLSGAITVGVLVAYNTLILLANPALQFLLRFWDELQQAEVLMNRLQDVFDAEPEEGARERQPVPRLGGRVRLRRVSFAYAMTPDRPVVDDVTLDVEPGTTVAFVGRSGSGKSTLAKCIAGIVPVSAGAVEFDGVDLRDLRLSDLRRRIGFVLQDSYLFSDTIARNIALGEKPDLAAVRTAAEIANAAEFIEALPLGYNTQIGESGIGLSGGQAQRIAIARALYHQPPVIVLDEATSALDAEAERAVTENIERLIQGRTAFVIAHRLSTIRSADVIAVLEQGRLVETGSHDELMARRGLYYHLNAQQLTA
jgi:ABC-type bacteriocin/lantibiotic exporter with double-glycine peptidase domain/CRP-like cAMP-binding protein